MGVGSADFDYVGKLFCFMFEFNMQGFEPREEDSMNLYNSCNVHNCREAVVAGLTSVDVVVGVNQFSTDLSSEKFDGSVSNDFVGIHVGLCS